MEALEFWTQWGSGLNDRNFANAFTALGILQANFVVREKKSRDISPETDQQLLSSLTYSALQKVTQKEKQPDFSLIQWGFPEPESIIQIEQTQFALKDLSPDRLAVIWDVIANAMPFERDKPNLRIRIQEYPGNVTIRPWFRILSEAAPDNKSIYINFDTAYPEIHMKWPIRMGFIPNNSAKRPVYEAHGRWPSNTNARLLPIGRDNDNADVFVFDGSLSALKKSLKELPVPMKCNLFIIRGPDDNHSPEFFRLMNEITSVSRANGWIYISNTFEDEQLAYKLNDLVNGLCHNEALDFVVSKIFANSGSVMPDPVIFLGKQLAMFRLKHMVDKVIKRLSALPRSAKINVSSDTRHRLNIPESAAFEDVAELQSVLEENRENMVFIAESTGATGITEINESLEEAEMSPEIEETRQNRYISAKTFVKDKDAFQPTKRAFLLWKSARINVRIGPPDKEWTSLNTPVDMSKLPEQEEAWKLKVVMSDPNHIATPLVSSIKLPKNGPSTECEFQFTPLDTTPFEGRITVLHRGRVIQTAVLKMAVAEDLAQMPETDQLELTEVIPVRSHLGNLEERRQFDAAFVTNHTSSQRPVLTGIAKDHAWLANLEACKPITEEINLALSEVAFSVEDYKTGLESEKGKELLKRLVFSGCELYSAIVESELMRPTNRADIAKMEYLQIVSTKNDSVIPFEFIYDREVPDDDATLCPHWKEALLEGKCHPSCDKNQRKIICPTGFWGLSKVIERHDVTPELADGNREHLLQSEAVGNRSELNLGAPVLFATSSKVGQKDAQRVILNFQKAFGMPPITVDTWENWETEVVNQKPLLIIALTHTEGTGANATLEIGSKTLRSIQIRASHVRPCDPGAYPLVALLGCDTSGSAIEYGKYIRQFRLKGASVVIGTIATVFGGHAARVAEMLIDGLMAGKGSPERLGEIIRNLKRKAITEGQLMPLCLVAFGDADWKLT
jgi:hypothetical protein